MAIITETFDWAENRDVDASGLAYAMKGDHIAGTLPAGDKGDLIRIPMAAEETYKISASGNVRLALVDDGYFYAEPGTEPPVLAQTSDQGGAIEWTAVHPSPNYYLLVTGSGSYNVGIEGLSADSIVDEAGDNPLSAAPLLNGQTITGIINGRADNKDSDWYEVKLLTDHAYTWNLTPINSEVGATAGGLLTLYDANGEEVTAGLSPDMSLSWSAGAWANDGYGIYYSASAVPEGTYYIGVTTYYGFNDSGSYLLTMGSDKLPVPTVTLSAPDSLSATESGIAEVTFDLSASATETVTATYRAINGKTGYIETEDTIVFNVGESVVQTSVDVSNLSSDSGVVYIQLTSVTNAILDKSSVFTTVNIATETPETDIPETDIPGIDIPGIDIPGIDIPAIETPNITNDALIADLLSPYGFVAAQAVEWIEQNLDKPVEIYVTAKTVGLSNPLLADMLQASYAGITAEDIDDFFTANGIVTARALLQQYGLTLDQASAWIADNRTDSTLIQQTAADVGLDDFMLSEIVGILQPGITPAELPGFLGYA